jgi:hypothetical protein
MIYNNERDPNVVDWENQSVRQEVESMLQDVAVTDGDYKTGYQQAILNVLSILDYHNIK